MTRPYLPLVLGALLAAATPFACAADAAKAEGAKSDTAKPEEKIPEAKVSVTKHQGRIGATSLAYTATAGTMLMKNEKDESIALFGFTAYTKDGADIRTRPIMFAYNGGPGSASAWLRSDRSSSATPPRSSTLASPQSITCTSPKLPTMTFDGFRSR